MVRKPISKRVRFEVFKRDEFTCVYCGSKPPNVLLHVDHVIPCAADGSNDISNLVTACESCNQGKGARSLDSFPEQVVRDINRRREIAEQTRAFNQFLAESREEQNEAIDRIASHWFRNCGDKEAAENSTFVLADRESVRRFLERLTEMEIIHAVDRAHARRPHTLEDGGFTEAFRYFCGTCWGKIKDRKL